MIERIIEQLFIIIYHLDHLPFFTFTVFCMIFVFSFWALKDEEQMEKMELSTEGVLFRKENYRLLSSGFIHANWVHYLMNMISFFIFAFDIELEQGHLLSLFIFLGSVLAGSIFGIWNNRHDPHYRAVGASAGISGIVFASLLSSRPSTLILFVPMPIPIPDWAYGIIFYVFSFLAMEKKNDNIGHDAHLAGLIFGIFSISIFRWEAVTARPFFLASMIGLIVTSFAWYFFRDKLSKKFWKEKIAEYEQEKEENEEETRKEDLELLLEKISKSGIKSLSRKEKKRLEEISKQLEEN